MISVETLPYPNQNNDVRSTCINNLYGNNCSNDTPAHQIEIAKTEESKVALLEKSIEFLRSQHENMLKALHMEIEQLRRLNKALQFRLVMCCCTTNKDNLKDERTTGVCSSIEEAKGNEIALLKQQLEEERQKTSILQKKLESVKLTQTAIIDSSMALQRENIERTQNFQRSHDKIKPQDSSQISSGISKNVTHQRTSQSTGTKPMEYVTMNRIEKSAKSNVVKHSAVNRIVSPELNPDSSSSAILLSPNTVIDTPDGFWVRPSVATLNNPAGARVSVSPKDGRTSAHILPVKLPVLRTPESLNQVTVRDTARDILTPKLHPANEDLPKTPEAETIAKKFSNQSNEARYSRSSRSVRNIIKMYEAARNTGYPTTRSHNMFPGYSNSNMHHEPFLPAIPRSADPSNSGRGKKIRDHQKKCSHRTLDHGHP